MTLIAFGYNKAGNAPRKWLTPAQLELEPAWAQLHPEFRRRNMALFLATEQGDGRCLVGFGGGARSSSTQRITFESRTHVVACPGDYKYMGGCRDLNSNAAPAAPPGLSWHEKLFRGWAAAIDAIEVNLGTGLFDGKMPNWLRLAPSYKIRTFHNIGKKPERWHGQFWELPTSFSKWKGEDVQVAQLPGQGKPPTIPPFDPANGKFSLYPFAVKPMIKIGSTGDPVRYCQGVLRKLGYYHAKVDGFFGNYTADAVKAFQRDRGLKADGIVGPAQTWPALDAAQAAK